MLKHLLYINLRSLFFGSTTSGIADVRKRKPYRTVLIAILLLYAFGVFAVLLGSIFWSIYEPYHMAGLDWFYFGFAGMLSFGLCFIFSIFATKSQLYEAGDNEFLLSMPIKPLTILSSRIVSLLLLNYLYSAIVMIPAFVVYLILEHLSIPGIIIFIIVFLTLPLLSLALSCLFGWLLALATSKMRNKNIFTMVLSLGFLAAYFYFYSHMTQYIQSLTENSETIARAVQKAAFPVYHMGNAIANASIPSLLLFLLTAIVPFAAVMYILSRSFLSITTENKGTAKVEYVEKRLKASGSSFALFKKDLAHFVSSPIYMMNGALGSVLVVALPVIALFNKSFMGDFSGALEGIGISAGLVAAAFVAMCVSPNMVSAPSVSLEGKTLWICRTLPVPSRSILLSKAALHFAVTEPAVIIAVIIFGIILKPGIGEFLLMLLFPTAFTAFAALLGVTVNLRFPKFDWVSEAQVIKQGASVLVTMLITMGAIGLPIILYAVLLAPWFPLAVFMLIITVIYIIAAVLLYFYLIGSGSRRFESLQ
ncbi:MAG: hypothetical protein IJL71_00560 [Oscillospiraceae bacterium]|nr:hypothetical protein [Oscillospiraceae bacterium]